MPACGQVPYIPAKKTVGFEPDNFTFFSDTVYLPVQFLFKNKLFLPIDIS